MRQIFFLGGVVSSLNERTNTQDLLELKVERVVPTAAGAAAVELEE